jgi:2-polyprenyl-6-methoxyphenol hydroxylase-like FAD-dependent oxidoreductase
MGFEDAETLAYALARVFAVDSTPDRQLKLLEGWECHRMERIAKVVEFTNQGSSVRKANLTWYEQKAKEWTIRGFYKIRGLNIGSAVLYTYNAEQVLEHLS